MYHWLSTTSYLSPAAPRGQFITGSPPLELEDHCAAPLLPSSRGAWLTMGAGGWHTQIVTFLRAWGRPILLLNHRG